MKFSYSKPVSTKHEADTFSNAQDAKLAGKKALEKFLVGPHLKNYETA